MFPTQIQFRDIDESDFVWNAVLSHAEKLERFYDRIIFCHVTISAPHRHHHRGIIYHVQIRLSLPGGNIFVTTEPEKDHAHEDVYIAIRDAFGAAQRRLEDFIRKQRGVVKTSQKSAHGKVDKIFYADGYGFLRTPDDREIYFHQNAIVDSEFEDLNVGDEVRFHEEMGEQGPQVTSMSRVGRSGHQEMRP